MSNARTQLPFPAARAARAGWRRALSPTGDRGDAVFRVAMFLCALLTLTLAAAMIAER